MRRISTRARGTSERDAGCDVAPDQPPPGGRPSLRRCRSRPAFESARCSRCTSRSWRSLRSCGRDAGYTGRDTTVGLPPADEGFKRAVGILIDGYAAPRSRQRNGRLAVRRATRAKRRRPEHRGSASSGSAARRTSPVALAHRTVPLAGRVVRTRTLEQQTPAAPCDPRRAGLRPTASRAAPRPAMRHQVGTPSGDVFEGLLDHLEWLVVSPLANGWSIDAAPHRASRSDAECSLAGT